MKKERIICLALLTGFIFIANPLLSQSILQDSESDAKHGLTIDEWDKVNSRWGKFQPRTQIITNAGDTLSGQLISFTSETLTIYYGSEIPFIDIIEGESEEIAIKNINTILFTKGGPSSTGIIIGSLVGGGVGFMGGMMLTYGYIMSVPIVLGAGGMAVGGPWLGKWAQNSLRKTTISMDDYPNTISRKMNKVSRNQVLKEGFQADGDFDYFIKNSRSLRRVFPEKHLRISVGKSFGPSMIPGNLEEMLASATLAPIDYHNKGSQSIELYDLSWRFSDRYIGGLQLMFESRFTNVSNYDVENDNTYNNFISISESRIYFEYAPQPVNRTFSKKHELLLGGGIILSNPTSNFYYRYLPSPDAIEFESTSKDHSPNLIGFQLRSSFHYYLFPSFSVSAGVEGNLIQPMMIESYQLPTSDPLEFITIPDYKLNFSTVRFTVGASIYF